MNKNPDRNRYSKASRHRLDAEAARNRSCSSFSRSAGLTPIQRDLYLHSLIHPGSTTFNIGMSVNLGKDVNRTLWAEAVRWVAEHDEMAKTLILSVNGEPRQVFDPDAPVHFEFVDLSMVSASAGSAEQYLWQQNEVPFDLSVPPLWRNYLVQDRNGEYTAGLFTPHIVLDGLGINAFFKRVDAAYASLLEGKAPEEREFPAYYDYAESAVMLCDSAETEKYWRERLRDVATLDFPISHGPGRNVMRKVHISPGETEEIKQFCKGRGYRLPAFFMTVYGLLLQRYADTDEDFAVINILGGRPRNHFHTLGCFYQVLPYLFPSKKCSGDSPVSGVIDHIMQYLKRVGPRVNISNPLMNTLLRNPKMKCFYNYQSFARSVLLGKRRTYEIYIFHPEDEIHLAVTDIGDTIELELYYNENNFPYLNFLERLSSVSLQVCRHARVLSDIDIVLDVERHRMPAHVRRPGSAMNRDMNIHERFEVQAERIPDKTAVLFPRYGEASEVHEMPPHDMRTVLTYRELNEQANQLARHLQDLGAGPDRLVALCLDRSIDLVTAILAVFKAGGAYVALDPDYPQERLDFIMKDTAASLLVTRNLLLKRFRLKGCKAVCLDSDGEAIGRQSKRNTRPGVSAHNLAYVIYTSGSTGTPKGVLITHGNVSRLFSQTEEWFAFGSEDVWTLFHSCAFDFSVWELWGALIYGGRLVVVPKELSRAPDAFRTLLRNEQVTVLNQTPSAFYHLVRAEESLPSVTPTRLRYVIFGGEKLHIAALKPWIDRHGDASPQLINMYGITETTVHVTYRRITARDIERGSESVIGRAIPDLRMYLLDKCQRPVPPGFHGEICVAGAGVAAGYLNRQDLTLEKFIPDPFTHMPEERMYRSGDLGCMLPDGDVEYIGRIDGQVKIRGFRIEPGEINAVIASHPEVSQSVVVANTHVKGDKVRQPALDETRLVAYVVAHGGRKVSVSDLRSHLESRLPEFMIPAVFVFLDSLPLTPNGKIDREALPEPDAARPGLDQSYVPACTPEEKNMARIFMDVLGIDEVGIHDNFFHLGGHSLAATLLSSHVREVFQTDLPLCRIFEEPTVAGLAHCVASGDLMCRMHSLPDIKPVPRSVPLPVSSSQERVWFLLQLQPENRAYEFLSTLRFSGRLDTGTLERSLTELVRRHEIYRTTFREADGQVRQFIHEPWPVDLQVLDLSALHGEEQESGIDRCIRDAVRDPFDLGSLPLARWTLLRLRGNEHILIHFEHHLIHDGWSFVLFLKELMDLYRAFIEGRPSPLPELTVQFADFAFWQRAWLDGEAGREQLAYWKDRLSGIPPVLELPLDRRRPARQSFHGNALRVELTPEMSRAIESVSRKSGLTVYMTILAAYFALLYRYTGQEDMVIGTGIANRRWRETENLLGMIINNMALRCDLSGNPPFSTLMHRVREMSLEAYEHQDAPFEKVVEAVNPPRNPAYSPVFQTAFTSYDGFMPELKLPGLSITLEEGLSTGTAKFDLNVIAISRSRGTADNSEKAPSDSLSFIWEYNTDLFNADTISRMLGHYQTLLEGIITDSGKRVSDLPMLTEEEKMLLLVEWNGTETEYPGDLCIHELFEAQAEKTPDAVAVVYGDHSLTYRELNGRANQLARYLQKRGAGPEAMVGVLMERSMEMIIGLLGILKAGGTYVPLDPEYPRQRLSFMLEDTGVKLLLSTKKLMEGLPEHRARVVCMDAEKNDISEEDDTGLPCSVTPDNLAYVMYTSGSTGRPKGICVPHRGIVRLVMDTDFVELTADETFLQFAPVSFDASTFEIWGCLLNGARLVVFPRERPSLEELGQVIRQHEVTVLWLTAGLFHQMVESQMEVLKHVRQLLAGGDVLSISHVRKFLEESACGTLINGYGPTENTTFTCCYGMKQAGQVTGASVPVGRPIANTEVYVLDTNVQPAPIGVPGELYIGGDGLARSYLNRAGLTAERFVPHPFSSKPGARLYRSGDRVRYRSDGTIEFLGRLDNQVKIRGFRIEPGEVEAVLGQHPGLSEVVVTAREDGAQENQLVAYVVASRKPAPAVGELRGYLKHRLPGYMVPSVYVMLEEIPLTPNGKVDRKALPVPDGHRPETGGRYVAPGTPVEKALAAIWEQMLGVDRVGVHDNFFELGGHSLMATRVISRIRDTFNVELPLTLLFEESTVAGLAGYVQKAREENAGPKAPAISRINRQWQRQAGK